MLARRFGLFRMRGIPVRVHVSWLPVVVLLLATEALVVFPALVPGLSSSAYWWMAIAGAVGVLLSLLFGEVSQAAGVRSLGIPIEQVTLFAFGGVAETRNAPASIKNELLAAVVGCLSHLLLSAVSLCAFIYSADSATPVAVAGTVLLLVFVNLLLAAFKLVPTYPFAGGRLLFAIVAAVTGDANRAIRIAGWVAAICALVLAGLGGIAIARGSPVAGIWLLLVGFLLHHARLRAEHGGTH